jgi:hypothetical protein
MTMLGIDSLLDIKSFSNGLTKSISSDLGKIIPIMGVDYIKKFSEGAVAGYGGTMGMVAYGAICGFAEIWKINMLLS